MQSMSKSGPISKTSHTYPQLHPDIPQYQSKFRYYYVALPGVAKVSVL